MKVPVIYYVKIRMKFPYRGFIAKNLKVVEEEEEADRPGGEDVANWPL